MSIDILLFDHNLEWDSKTFWGCVCVFLCMCGEVILLDDGFLS